MCTLQTHTYIYTQIKNVHMRAHVCMFIFLFLVPEDQGPLNSLPNFLWYSGMKRCVATLLQECMSNCIYSIYSLTCSNSSMFVANFEVSNFLTLLGMVAIVECFGTQVCFICSVLAALEVWPLGDLKSCMLMRGADGKVKISVRDLSHLINYYRRKSDESTV